MFLTLEHAGVRYPGTDRHAHGAVEDASLRLQAGQLGVLIGPSGCGKTTLLRAIAGLERLQQGRITIDGAVLSDAAAGVHLPPERRQVGMVFQDFALFPHLSVAGNVGFGLKGLPRGEAADRMAEVLELVGLQHAARRLPHELSGGQQQRVALARALAPRPRLLLLDEPFSSLDVDLRERLAHEVRAILRAAGTTALFVTHDQLEAFAVGDLIGVMHRGRLEQWDDAYSLYHRPTTRFVADFIGHGVFAPARIVGACDADDDRGPCSARVETPLGDLVDVAGCPLADAYPGGECDVLLRADDIVHDDHSPVKACIERKSFRGSEFLYTLRLASGLQVLAHVPSHHDHQVGEWIGIRAQVDHVVTFPRLAEHPPGVRPPSSPPAALVPRAAPQDA
jgi:iron(III) transport system ATP-binding protein